jgi:hypothetical protein
MADNITIEATILSGQTKTEAINIENFFLQRVEVPASMTGTSFSLEVGGTAATTVPLRNETNTLISITISTTAAAYPIDANYTAGSEFVKIVSGSAETGAKVLKLHGYRI